MKITICIASVLTVSLTTLPSLHAQAANSQVERGQYLVAIMGCHDCHSPKLPGTMKPDPAAGRGHETGGMRP